MQSLETQVVKIQLGDNKQASSFVFTLAETIDLSETEVYVICELPMFNPAAMDECQRISEAISASLKRSYRKQITANTFENALAVINEELSKLVTIGKTHWLGKLNSIIAVKHNNILSVSSVGKISALLYRDGTFVSVTEASSSNHPLKTFEHFSEGKLRLGDMFVLSTSQLFNHLSIDRIKRLVDKYDLPNAAQQIIDILQDDMGPEVACGTIFALQVEPGSTTDEEVDLNSYLGDSTDDATLTPASSGVSGKLKTYAATGTVIAKNFAKDFKEKYVRQSYWRGLLDKSGQGIGVVQSRLKKTAAAVTPQNIGNYSRQKKFFLISAAVLLLVLGVNIAIAKFRTTTVEQQTVSTEQITSIEKLLSDANAALLYGDEDQAMSMFKNAQSQINGLPQNIAGDQSAKLADLKKQASDLDLKLNKVEQAKVTNLGTLGNGNSLINLSNFIGTETNRTIVSYNKTTGTIADNALRSSESIVDSIALKNNLAAIYTGSELFIWNTQTSVLLGAFSTQVPSKENLGGMATYSTNNKVYLLDKANGVVRSYSTTDKGFSAPAVAVEDSSLKNASGLAIDGNIYTAVNGTIAKYNSGAKQDFTPAISNISNKTQLYTQTDFTRLYVLDSENKKISILNKDGSLVKTLTSDQFGDLRDFAVDEKNSTIYVLNGTELLKIGF